MTYRRDQTHMLESRFSQTAYVTKKQREELMQLTNLTDRQIKVRAPGLSLLKRARRFGSRTGAAAFAHLQALVVGA